MEIEDETNEDVSSEAVAPDAIISFVPPPPSPI